MEPAKNPNKRVIGIGIRDTSATDRVVERPQRKWLWPAVGGGVLILALLVVVAAPSVLRWSSADASISAERLRFATVTRGSFVRDIAVPGRVVAAASPTLYAPAAGTVTFEVAPGDRVESGQLLATLDSPEAQSELSRETSTLSRVEVELDRQRIQTNQELLRARQTIDLANVTVEAAERELERMRVSMEHGVIRRLEYDQAQDALRIAQLQHAHAVEDARLQEETLRFEVQTRELEVARQRVVVGNLQRRVDELSIRSPVSGVVGNLAVEQKAAVNPNQPLLMVVDLTALEVEIQVPESYADSLGIGMPAEVNYGTQTLPGRIASVSPEVQNGQITTRVRFDGEVPGDLRQNQRVSARVLLDRRDDVLVVRRGAFLESGGGRIAYVMRDGLAVRTPITIGATSIGEVEIVSGLEEGDTLVVSSIEDFQGANTVLVR